MQLTNLNLKNVKVGDRIRWKDIDRNDFFDCTDGEGTVVAVTLPGEFEEGSFSFIFPTYDTFIYVRPDDQELRKEILEAGVDEEWEPPYSDAIEFSSYGIHDAEEEVWLIEAGDVSNDARYS